MQCSKLVNLDIMSDEKQDNITVLKQKIRLFKTMIARLNEQLEVVNWYINMSEDGVDTKDLVETFGKLKIDYKTLDDENRQLRLDLYANTND